MVDKREKMRRNARRELAKREKLKKGVDGESEKPETPIGKEENIPSANSGFVMLFMGSMTLTVFFMIGQPIVGVFASLAFMVIGMRRISRATSKRKAEILTD